MHDHDHSQHHDHHHHGVSANAAPTAVIRAIGVTSVFMVVEMLGGYFSNSLALTSDAAHMLTDVGAMLLTLFVLWIARRPSNHTMSFGYHRAEILGALASGLSIWLIAGFLIYEAVVRMQAPPEVKGPLVFVVAMLGFIANLVSMHFLHKAKDHNLNVRAAYLHVIADLLGSVGAIIAGSVLWATGWRPIDPIITLIFSGLMLWNSGTLIKESIQILMESTPIGLDPEKICADLEKIPQVKEVHDLHIWSVGSGMNALSVHLISEHAEQALESANDMLHENYGIRHTTIQVEHPDHFRSEHCYSCGPAHKHAP